MRYVKPHYYEEFECTADRCPATCCAGWQIVIDEESLDAYSKVKGDFGKKLRQCVDWEEGVFTQNNGRCSFLNDKNLCDLYVALGKMLFAGHAGCIRVMWRNLMDLGNCLYRFPVRWRLK